MWHIGILWNNMDSTCWRPSPEPSRTSCFFKGLSFPSRSPSAVLLFRHVLQVPFQQVHHVPPSAFHHCATRPSTATPAILRSLKSVWQVKGCEKLSDKRQTRRWDSPVEGLPQVHFVTFDFLGSRRLRKKSDWNLGGLLASLVRLIWIYGMDPNLVGSQIPQGCKRTQEWSKMLRISYVTFRVSICMPMGSHGILVGSMFSVSFTHPKEKKWKQKNCEKPASGKSKGSDAWKRSETSRQRKSIEMHPSKSRVTRYVGMVCFLFISFLLFVIYACFFQKKMGYVEISPHSKWSGWWSFQQINYWLLTFTFHAVIRRRIIYTLWPTCHRHVLLKRVDFHPIPILKNSPTSASAMICNRILSPQNTPNKNLQKPETLAKIHARFCLYGTWSTPPCARAFTVSWRAASVSCGAVYVNTKVAATRHPSPPPITSQS